MPGNLAFFHIAETFLPGGDMVDKMRASGHACMHFQEVLLMQEAPFWSGVVDTQSGLELDLERRVYSTIRDMYLRKVAPQTSLAAGKSDPVVLLYLGRPQTEARHILNEHALLESMRAIGTTTPGVEVRAALDFDSIPFEEQIKQSSSADILIGPHGAGLTHVMFMRPHSVLIELLPHAWADPGYRSLAQYSDVTYMHWQQTEEALSDELLVVGNSSRRTGRSNSFYADIPAVMSLLTAAINIEYMVGERYWPPCPGYEIIKYKRGVPVACPQLWKRDEGVKSRTPQQLMQGGVPSDVHDVR